MTFTYDLASGTSSIALISKVRLEIGDVASSAGVRPNGANFTDEEITHWLSEEGDDVMLATVRACEALSRAWSVVANNAIGPRREDLGKVASDWAKRAETLRAQYGGAGAAGFGVTLKRVDGYSIAAESTDDYGS